MQLAVDNRDQLLQRRAVPLLQALSIQVTFCEGADKTLDSALAPQKNRRVITVRASISRFRFCTKQFEKSKEWKT